MSKKGVKGQTGSIRSFLAKPTMVEPFEPNYVGKFFSLMGTFWPGGTAAVNATEYRVRIIGVNRTYKGPKGKTVAFKVQQMQPDDPNGTGTATVLENVNYWWVEKDALDGPYLDHVAKVAAAAAHTKAIVDAVSAAAAAPALAKPDRLQSEWQLLYDVTKGTRVDEKGVAQAGTWHRCRAPKCEHTGFFVSTKVSFSVAPLPARGRRHGLLGRPRGAARVRSSASRLPQRRLCGEPRGQLREHLQLRWARVQQVSHQAGVEAAVRHGGDGLWREAQGHDARARADDLQEASGGGCGSKRGSSCCRRPGCPRRRACCCTRCAAGGAPCGRRLGCANNINNSPRSPCFCAIWGCVVSSQF